MSSRYSLRARAHQRRSRSLLRRSGTETLSRRSKRPAAAIPKLVTLKSPYRYILTPIVDYVLNVERETDTCKVCVLIPELVVRHWWEGCCTTAAPTC